MNQCFNLLPACLPACLPAYISNLSVFDWIDIFKCRMGAME